MEKFREKYTGESEKNKPENKNKIVIPDNAFALCEALLGLTDKIEHLRRAMLK